METVQLKKSTATVATKSLNESLDLMDEILTIAKKMWAGEMDADEMSSAGFKLVGHAASAQGKMQWLINKLNEAQNS